MQWATRRILAGTSFLCAARENARQIQARARVLQHPGRPHAGAFARRTACGTTRACPPTNGLIAERCRIFKEYQTTREQASWVAPITGTKHSHGCSFADSWGNVQFQRMPNVSLLPNEKGHHDGGDHRRDEPRCDHPQSRVVVDRSPAIQLPAFLVAGMYHEVRNGKIVGMLKDVAYQASTPVFWNSMDMLGVKHRTASKARSMMERVNPCRSVRSRTAVRRRGSSRSIS